MIDKSIAVAITLFVLSLISERFVSWMKLYFGRLGKRLIFFSDRTEDLTSKTNDPIEINNRERKILGLNIILSVFIAFVAHANLFDILNSADPYSSLGWDNVSLADYNMAGNAFIGCILSGLFISLGSKFWHDTLDMLLYSKNLKEKSVQKETYNVDKIEQLDSWLQQTKSDVVKKVFEDNKQLLGSLSNVLSYGIGHNDKNEKIIELVLSSPDTSHVPSFLNYIMPNGSSTAVEVKTRFSGSIKTQAKLSDEVSNLSKNTLFGSLGLVVHFRNDVAKKPMFLSCYHVLKSYKHDYNFFSPVNEEDIVSPNSTSNKIGKLLFGIRNHEIDAAYCDSTEVLQTALPDGGMLNGTREINYQERYQNIPVKIYSAANKKEKRGFVKSLYNGAFIDYTINPGNIEKWSLINLIAIADENNKAISEDGDSGSIVLDMDNKVIAMVVAGSDSLTYAMPINSILNTLNLNIL